tara:strand:+ start:17182 stop:18084 length:903 start_codon:yes stop_codon:yes gene_type:complete
MDSFGDSLDLLDDTLVCDDLFTGMFDIDPFLEVSVQAPETQDLLETQINLRTQETLDDIDQPAEHATDQFVEKPLLHIPEIESFDDPQQTTTKNQKNLKTTKKKQCIPSSEIVPVSLPVSSKQLEPLDLVKPRLKPVVVVETPVYTIYIENRLRTLSKEYDRISIIVQDCLAKLKKMYPGLQPHEFPGVPLMQMYEINQAELTTLNKKIIDILLSVEKRRYVYINKKMKMCRIKYDVGRYGFIYLWHQNIYIPMKNRPQRIVKIYPHNTRKLIESVRFSRLHPIVKNYLIDFINDKYVPI